MKLKVKRVYDPPAKTDGLRVLVDRLWPRGLSKDKAKIDHWLKDIAPSDGLRKWFAHDPDKWKEFKRRYFTELDKGPERVSELRALARKGTVTLLFGAKDAQHNNAVALAEYLVTKHRTPRGG
ncbi:MAG: hypothetical protein A2151_03680 [Candidatus Muproteobacteria bacterium RBG_16_65_34]|uniref:MarR family transcriptional regulator n=1 Tax=Candidatus Muproteobacteria bacterium RBG_16_65_34 TaxID=1817760 RepID=A0A1F6TN52_9PROT|nr:MAG: hypothetical protein A2151_03680 [Candidatus Muproteobacteria bacterium RBG_16_65_34]